MAYDDAKYVFGSGEKHEGFVALLREAEEATGDEGLAACVRFYERPDEVTKALELFDTKVTGGILLSVSPSGPVILREGVREFWRERYERKLG